MRQEKSRIKLWGLYAAFVDQLGCCSGSMPIKNHNSGNNAAVALFLMASCEPLEKWRPSAL